MLLWAGVKTLSLKLALVLLSLLLVGAGLFAAARYQPLDAAPAVPAITLAPRGQRAALDKLLAAVRHARDPRLSFVTEGVATPPLSRTLNILLAGVDTRPGGWGGRTDALVVLVIDGSSQHVGLISVPRDLLVGIPESDDPRAPRVIATIGGGAIRKPRAIAVQFRYAFVVDADGLKVLDITMPGQMSVVPGADVPITDARSKNWPRRKAPTLAIFAG